MVFFSNGGHLEIGHFGCKNEVGEFGNWPHWIQQVKILYGRDGIQTILTMRSLEKDLVRGNCCGGKFVIITSLCTSEVNVYKLYFEKSVIEDIQKPLQSNFYSCSRLFSS